MKKRKLLSILLCLTLVFAFTACGDKGTAKSAQEKEQTGPTLAEENAYEVDKTKGPIPENKAYGELSKEIKADWDKRFDYGQLAIGGVGDTLSNDFFDWTVHSVKSVTEINGKKAAKGKKFVVVNMSMTNTEDYTYPSGNFEFDAALEAGQEVPLETLDAFYEGMIPDEVDFAPGETMTGDIIFEVEKSYKRIIIDYGEYYGDDSQGNTFWFELEI